MHCTSNDFTIIAACASTFQSLNLSNNRLEQLPDNVGDFPSLVKLDVSNNSMRFLPTSMGQFRKIQRIDVSNNLLSRYGKGVEDYNQVALPLPNVYIPQSSDHFFCMSFMYRGTMLCSPNYGLLL